MTVFQSTSCKLHTLSVFPLVTSYIFIYTNIRTLVPYIQSCQVHSLARIPYWWSPSRCNYYQLTDSARWLFFQHISHKLQTHTFCFFFYLDDTLYLDRGLPLWISQCAYLVGDSLMSLVISGTDQLGRSRRKLNIGYDHHSCYQFKWLIIFMSVMIIWNVLVT